MKVCRAALNYGARFFEGCCGCDKPNPSDARPLKLHCSGAVWSSLHDRLSVGTRASRSRKTSVQGFRVQGSDVRSGAQGSLPPQGLVGSGVGGSQTCSGSPHVST